MNRKSCVPAAIFIGGLMGAGAEADTLSGWVRSGTTPIAQSTVTLYRAGSQPGSGNVQLATAQTNALGFFSLEYAPPTEPEAVVYAIARGPNETTRLATVVGTGTAPSQIMINERTTVATAFTMAQFIVGDAIGGNNPGVQNAAGTLRNLVNPETGEVGTVLGSAPNGMHTTTMRKFNSLANLLAGCAGGFSTCPALFALATPPGGVAPLNTLDAAVNIAHHAWQNASQLYDLSRVNEVYQPALILPPHNWALAIKYAGNGHEFSGPGAVAIDERGDVWISNNYTFKHDKTAPSGPSQMLLKLTATGADAPGVPGAPGAPYHGKQAGLSGAGFGITLDPGGNVWVGNFGFYGSTCPQNLLPPANSVSAFDPRGRGISPRTGFTQGCITSPQGTVSDPQGNIWIANACNGSVTQYRNGNPADHWVFNIATGQLALPGQCPSGPAKPFDIAIDAAGNAWVTDNGLGRAYKLSPTGQLLATSSLLADLRKPLGLAIDSRGHVWIADSGVANLPCETTGAVQGYGSLLPDPNGEKLTELGPDGALVGTYRGGGLQLPWGVAVDGKDRIWVSSFGGQHLCEFDSLTGQPIAPDGYYDEALMRNTGVSIDPSGNVWVTNNWLLAPIPTNPGGDSMMVFIGLAAPVKTPLLGPVRQP